jgi:hypothetical protein
MVTRYCGGVLAALTLLGMSMPLLAQTASIAGTVRDPSGAVLPGVSVAAAHSGTGLVRRLVTDASGFYNLTLLPVGTYDVSVEAPGFRPYLRRGFAVNVQQEATLDVVLEVGDVKEAISVIAEAPLLNTRSSELTALIDPVRMTELPLNGRNPLELAGLLPGVQGVVAPEFALDTNAGPRISVGGSRPNHNAMLFDGAVNSYHFRNVAAMYPSPDSLREFQVITNLFSAEFGSSGGGVLNAITRSGTNAFHGSLYEFLRNDNLNARNAFLPRKTNLIQNQFGATGGGRIIRNHLFYFAALEFLRVRPEAAAATAFPPTAAERAGDFSALPRPITDPVTRQPFPGNRIPVSRFDPVATAILNQYLPLPNQPDGRFISQSASPTNVHQFTLKLDYQASNKHTFSNRFFTSQTRQQSPLGGSNLPGYSPGEQAIEVPLNNVSTWTMIPSATMVNELRFSLFYSDNPIVNFNRQQLAELGAAFPHIPGHPSMPSWFNVVGRFQLQAQLEQTRREEHHELHNNLTWQRGTHSMKMGGRWFRAFSRFDGYFQKDGNFTFDRSITGDSLADFLLGKPASLAIVSPAFSRYTLGNQFGLYFQDDWRLSPQLTVNLGMRYEVQLPWTEERGQWSRLYRNSGYRSQRYPNAPVDMAFYGDPGVPNGMVSTDWIGFQPRIGFAYSPTALRKTVIRGGAGVFGELSNADIIQNTGQPFQFNRTIFAIGQLSDPLRELGPLPLLPDLQNPTFNPPFGMFYPTADFRNGNVYHYNLVIQREVGTNLSVEAAYVGKQSRKLTRTSEVNPAIFVPGNSTLANIESRRIYRPGLYSGITESSSSANASYNAFQLQVMQRLARGFSVQAAYTFSKSIDDSSSLVIGGPLPNPFDWSSQRGLSDFDSTHNANTSFVIELPKLGTRFLSKALLHNWQLSGIVSARSGNPFTIVSGRDIALSGTPNQTPNVVGDAKREHSGKADAVDQWFNPAAFALPAAGQFGNSARNNVRGPGFWNVTTGVFRTFPIREQFRLQFRSEFFNVLNHTNLSNPINNMNNAAFGRILSAAAPRVIQFALKLNY